MGGGDRRGQWGYSRSAGPPMVWLVEVLSPASTTAPASIAPSIARRSPVTVELARSVAFRALLLAIVVAPSSLSFTITGRGSDWTRDPVIRLVDAPLMVIAALQLLPVLAQVRRSAKSLVARRWTSLAFADLAFGAMVAWVGVSWAVQPRAIGGLMVIRLVGALGVVNLVIRASGAQRAVLLKTMVGLVVFEAALCGAQLIVDGPIGFSILGELADPFNRTGPWRAPTGTSYYPYPLSAVALLTLGLALWGVERGLVSRRWAIAGGVAAGVIVGTGFSVIGAAIALAVVVAFLGRRVPSGNRRFLGAAGVTLLLFVSSLVVTGLVLSDGWLWKGERSTSSDAALASSGRSGQLGVGMAMAKRWPVLGIGAGNFAVVREAHDEFDAVSTDDQITHSMPVLMAVESGFAALVLFVAGLAALAWRRVRSVAVIAASMSGYVLGDLMHWYSGFGVLCLGVWLGFLFVVDEPTSGAAESDVKPTAGFADN